MQRKHLPEQRVAGRPRRGELGSQPEAVAAGGELLVQDLQRRLQLIQGALGSMFNAMTTAHNNGVALRPGGQVRIIDGTNLVAGDQGRWGDSAPLDLNGGTFRYDGAANYQSVETIGASAWKQQTFLIPPSLSGPCL